MSRGLLAAAALLTACCGPQTKPEPKEAPTPAPESTTKALDRLEFNQRASRGALPLFWINDANKDGVLNPDELAATMGLNAHARSHWVKDGAFTPAFAAAMATMQAEATPTGTRGKTLRAEVDAGRPTIVYNDLRTISAAEKTMVRNVVAAAAIVERLYHRQKGVEGMQAQIPAGDTLAQAIFHRNHGPYCMAPTLDADPLCSALPTKPAKISGLYPAAMQTTPDFCKQFTTHADARTLLNPFKVVVQNGDTLSAVPYTEHWAEETQAVAALLKTAADALRPVAEEAAFVAYLDATAKAFGDNDWHAADESWAKMNANNSKWYLRIGPDETYFEPCNEKAGFHTSFARINPDSVEWQKKLDPIKGDMEKALAALAGAPYTARQVDFHLPDFIDIVLNAGDARSPFGATIGQSLPNWGPVANEGRGRTVAMTNLYTDPDSKRWYTRKAESVLCTEAMARYTPDDGPRIMNTVLHEAAHNLGPAHEYKVGGKTDGELFGGPLAATLEELKAQTASLYFAEWLADRGVIDHELTQKAHTSDMLWAFGQISNGLYTGDGRNKPYPQLASMQVGTLMDAGALTWHADKKAANGEDVGCFTLDFKKMKPAIEGMMTRVAHIKAKGDKADAEAMKAKYVDAKDAWSELRTTITERWRRSPKATFVYSIRLDD
jgi:hypothetical protein